MVKLQMFIFQCWEQIFGHIVPIFDWSHFCLQPYMACYWLSMIIEKYWPIATRYGGPCGAFPLKNLRKSIKIFQNQWVNLILLSKNLTCGSRSIQGSHATHIATWARRKRVKQYLCWMMWYKWKQCNKKNGKEWGSESESFNQFDPLLAVGQLLGWEW